ncbi:MAG TPA: hypothetical protein PK370_02840 [Candidatus Woesebacteria bacterium]|nr:hypothetical protein [Candidatus Woesebacteria bacterium]HPJ16784.1 hypothetical protein [Candidatus Woesebacteria bacterium]
MDPTQIVISIALILVASIIVAVGVYIILLIKDLRKSLSQVTLILEDTKTISTSIAKPVSSVSEFVMGFKNGFKIFNNILGDDKE